MYTRTADITVADIFPAGQISEGFAEGTLNESQKGMCLAVRMGVPVWALEYFDETRFAQDIDAEADSFLSAALRRNEEELK